MTRAFLIPTFVIGCFLGALLLSANTSVDDGVRVCREKAKNVRELARCSQPLKDTEDFIGLVSP